MKKMSKDSLSWFNIKNYNFLEKITTKQFLHELLARTQLYRASFNYDHWGFDESESAMMNSIINGTPEIRQHINLSNPNMLRPLSVADINHCHKTIYEYFDLKAKIESSREIKETGALATYSIPNDIDFYISVNLSQYNDEQLTLEFQSALKLWRKEYNKGVESPATATQDDKKLLTDAFRYAIIPLTDLFIWENIKNQSIPPLNIINSIENPVLFNYEIDEGKYKDTIMPFFQRFYPFINDDYNPDREGNKLSPLEKMAYLILKDTSFSRKIVKKLLPVARKERSDKK